MRNYFDALELQRVATAADIKKAINLLTPAQLTAEDDLESTMQGQLCLEHYRRSHLQYEAIAAAMSNPSMSEADNSHQWDKRVVEFEPVQNTIEL